MKELRINPDFLTELLKYIKIACGIGVAFVAIQLVVGPTFSFLPALNQNVYNGDSIRYPGFFMDSQMNGLFFAMCSFFFLINLDNFKKPSKINYIGFGVVAVAIILAGARSGLVGFAVALIITTLMVGGTFRLNTMLLSVAAVVIFLLFSQYFVIFDRFKTFDDSLSFRASIWDSAWEIFKDHFSIGIGFNNYKEFITAHAQDQFLLIDNDEIFYLEAPENGYLKLLVEFGFFATVALFLMILWPIANVFYKFIQGKKVNLAFFCLGSIICWFISCMSFHNLSDSRIVLLLCVSLVIMISFPLDPEIVNEY